MAATDPDGDELTYKLTGSGDEVWFSVGKKTGQLRVAKLLEKKVGDSYAVTITAKDGNGGTGQVEVTVSVEADVNHPPGFKHARAQRSVPRNALVGRSVGPPLAATDPDGDELTYKLTGSGDEVWFSVDGKTGQLRVAKLLEKKVGDSYALTITAEDGNGGTGQVEVTVSVEADVNHPPGFKHARAQRSVPRNALVGRSVGPPLAATDPDGDKLTYKLTGSGDEVWFSVDGKTGQLRVAKLLEKKVGDSYAVTITAEDGNGGTGQVEVTVSVEADVNHPPGFKNARAQRSVPRNALVGRSVGPPLAATDPDGDELTYKLTGSGDEVWFSVGKKTGQLRVAKLLEKKVGDSYAVTITAKDGNGGTGQVEVTVSVEADVNHPPGFKNARAQRSVPRNALVGRNVGPRLAATDPDGDELTYKLTGSGDEVWFSVDGKTGQLRVAKLLEKKVGDSYALTITAEDGNGGTGQVEVTVSVEADVNHPPGFKHARAQRSVPRNALVGRSVGPPLAATDPDGDELTYKLTGSGDEVWFSVGKKTGQLRVAKLLEKKVGDSYAVTITAKDGNGGTGQVEVTVSVEADVNHPPGFKNARAQRSVPRNALVGRNVGPRLAATDPDGDELTYKLTGSGDTARSLDRRAFVEDELTYKLTGSGDEVWFSVDGKTGQLRVAKLLEKKVGDSYALTITAEDGNGGTGQVEVTVSVEADVNHPPGFKHARAQRSVPRNALVGRSVGPPLAATDPDGDKLTYKLTGSGDEVWFSVGKKTGQLRVAKLLEKKVGDSYAVTITARDGNGGTGQVEVTVSVEADVNHPPGFKHARAQRSVPRNALVGRSVGPPLAATDPDGDKLTYKLTGSGDEVWFSVGKKTGQLRVAKLLEKKVGDSYAVTITAEDGNGGTGQVEVTVSVEADVNHPPGFKNARAQRSVPRNALVGRNVGPRLAATDPDGDELTYKLTGSGDTARSLDRRAFVEDELTYKLTGSGDEVWFSVDGKTGQLRVAKLLEKKVGDSYALTITAEDGNGGTGQVEVTVSVEADVNHPPGFKHARAQRSVPRNALVGRSVGPPLAATDPDGDELTYKLTGSGDEVWFSVGKKTGQLRVAKLLEKKVGDSYAVTITARDGNGGTGQVEVTVSVEADVNHPPGFKHARARRSVPRNALVGRNVGPRLAATDPDGDELTYKLTGSGDEVWFSVDGKTGQLRVAKLLEKKVGDSYALTITAEDGNGGTGQVEVTVSVEADVNQPPGFKNARARRSVPRNALVGRNVGPRLAATDPDGDELTYKLTGSGDEVWFSVGKKTGQLRVAKLLEKKVGDSYALTITAEDGNGGTGQVEVTVSVEADVNHPPGFKHARARRSVPRNALVGRSVGPPLAATDPDGDELTYKLTGSGDEVWFSVGKKTGQLRVAKLLEKKVGDSYAVTITAEDGNGGTGQVEVTVSVEADVNQPPGFKNARARRSVPRNALVGRNVGPRLAATDPDGDELTYKLTGSGDEVWFSVGKKTGQLRVAKLLEKKVGDSYALTITAEDGNGGTGQVEVTVTIGEKIISYKLVHARQDTASNVKIDNKEGQISFPIEDVAQLTEVTVEVDDGQTQIAYDVRISLTVEDNANSPSAFPAVDTAMRDVSAPPPDRQSGPLAKKAAPRSVLQPRSQAYIGGLHGSPVKAAQAGTLQSYTLSGSDKDLFDISADGTLTIKNRIDEKKRHYSITITVTDGNRDVLNYKVTIVIVQVGSTLLAEAVIDRGETALDAPGMAIWTDKLTYLPGDRMQLHLNIDPRSQEQDYTVFIYRTELSTGERVWLNMRWRPASFSPKVVDIHGQSELALWPRRLGRISKQLVWEGLVPAAGHWQFVAELRNSSATYTFKRAYARFMVAGGVEVIAAREGVERRLEVDERWLGNMVHVLQGRLLVPRGVTLQIEAGAHVLAKEGAAILVLPGGRIVARGRREKPIVMTCANPIGERVPGCWGGLEIRAEKSNNRGQVSTGELRYVRVEFAGGWPEGAGPAVDLLEASKATVLEYVQVHASLGQGFRFRGGNVVCYRCVASNTGQAGILWSDNFNGLLQDLYVQQEDPAASAIWGIAGDRRVHASINNATLLGGHDGLGKGSASGIQLMGDNAILKAKNVIVAGFRGSGIRAVAGSAKRFHSNDARSFIFGFNWKGAVNPLIATKMRIPIHLPQLLTVRPQPNPDPRPRTKSRALVPEAAVPVSAESRHASEELHVGAFAHDNWLEQWTWFGSEEQYRAQ